MTTLEKRLGYEFKNKQLLNLALTHKSAHHQNNERLEFLGDAILNFVVADLLYHHFPKAKEGELTRARAVLVRQKSLSDLALKFALSDFLHLGLGEQRSGGFRRESILADTVEAIIGAIYLDSGIEACQRCLKQWLGEKLAAIDPAQQEKDPKTQLQEILQANHRPLPKYEVVSIEGEAHAQTFTIRCEVEGVSQGVTGQGLSRRLAEQRAAEKMLELLK